MVDGEKLQKMWAFLLMLMKGDKSVELPEVSADSDLFTSKFGGIKGRFFKDSSVDGCHC